MAKRSRYWRLVTNGRESNLEQSIYGCVTSAAVFDLHGFWKHSHQCTHIDGLHAHLLLSHAVRIGLFGGCKGIWVSIATVSVFPSIESTFIKQFLIFPCISQLDKYVYNAVLVEHK